MHIPVYSCTISTFIEGNNIDEVIGILNTELAKLTVRLAVNKLTLNIKNQMSCFSTSLEYNGITLLPLYFSIT